MSSPTEDRISQDSSRIHLVYGDEFLVKEQVQRMISQILDPRLIHTNLITLDGASLDLSEFSALLFTPSLFGGNRIVLVEQTPFFMGKMDQQKLVSKVVEAWGQHDRKSAFRTLGQLLSLAGIDLSSGGEDSEWIEEVLGSSAPANRVEALMQAARAFVEEGRSARPAREDALLDEITSSPLPEGTFLIFTAAEVDKRKKTFKAFAKHAQVTECAGRQERYGTGLERTFFEERIQEALEPTGKYVTHRGLDVLYERAGSDLRRLHSEVGKLVGYVGDRAEITEDDVDAVVGNFKEAPFFALTNALRAGDLAESLPALHENLRTAAHPLATLAAIATEFRRLMVARELLFTVFRAHWSPSMTYPRFQSVVKKIRESHPGTATKSKLDLLAMNDYRLMLYLRDAQKFSLERLMGIMEALQQADTKLKSSRLASVDPGAILEELVVTICHPHTSDTQSRRPGLRQS